MECNMKMFQRSLIAAGAFTLLGAAYVNEPILFGYETSNRANDIDLPEAFAMQGAPPVASRNLSPSPKVVSPQPNGSASSGKSLFSGPAKLTSQASAILAAISKEPDTFQVRVMEANAGVVSPDTRRIELDLGSQRVNLVQERTEGTQNGGLTWIGHIKETVKERPHIGKETPHDALNSAILVSRGNGITGSIRKDGKLFRIRPLPGGSHAVIEVDESRRPADHPDNMIQARLSSQAKIAAADTASGSSNSNTGTAAVADVSALTTIRVMVAVTNEAVAAYAGDMQALVDLAVAESNQGYINSQIGIKMELAGYYTTDYSESGDWNTELARFQKKTDGYLDELHATRDTIGADVNVLLIDDASSCGLGYVNASAEWAYSVVHYGCATGYYSFAHEIGHNQGADHDPAAGTNLNFAYGHGYRAPNNSWRTIMAYNCTPSCPRVNYWSNPNVTYGGVAMGNSDKSDNHRVLNETKAKVAAFRQDPAQNVAPSANFSSSINLLSVSFVDSSTDSDGTVVARSWNFGDGTAASMATNPSHSYTTAGTYNVSLTVTDDNGTSHTMTKAITVKAAETYSSSMGYAINDVSTIYSPIVISGRTGYAPSNTSVTVDITHSYRGDLRIDLVAPDGSTYLLKNINGNDSADNVKATYTVSLAGKPLNGTWKLRVRDCYTDDTGFLNNWRITF